MSKGWSTSKEIANELQIASSFMQKNEIANLNRVAT